MTPEEFAKRIQEWGRGTMLEGHGTRCPTLVATQIMPRPATAEAGAARAS
jgi:hypothetical protein